MSGHKKLSLADNVGSAIKPGNDLTLFLVKSDKGGIQVLNPGSDYMVAIINLCTLYFLTQYCKMLKTSIETLTETVYIAFRSQVPSPDLHDHPFYRHRFFLEKLNRGFGLSRCQGGCEVCIKSSKNRDSVKRHLLN